MRVQPGLVLTGLEPGDVFSVAEMVCRKNHSDDEFCSPEVCVNTYVVISNVNGMILVECLEAAGIGVLRLNDELVVAVGLPSWVDKFVSTVVFDCS